MNRASFVLPKSLLLLAILCAVGCRRPAVAVLKSWTMVLENPFGLGAPGHNPAYIGDVDFSATFNRGKESVDAGRVTMNEIVLQRRGTEYHALRSDSNLGLLEHWHVSGSDDFPGFDDSLQIPTAFHVTFPKPRVDTISKRAGFTLTYENPAVDSVTITVWYDSTGTRVFIDSTFVHRMVSVTTKVPATRSYTVTPEQLSAFPDRGQCQIMITANESKTAQHNGAIIHLESESRARSYFMIAR